MVKLDRNDLRQAGLEAAEEYKGKDLSLTLRQLYYVLVSRALIPNSQESYKRLGDVLGEARLRGAFHPDLLIDRGREAGATLVERELDLASALEEAAEYASSIPSWVIKADRWFGQPVHVSVWVEKEALAGVFEDPCEKLGVGFFACKGYPSHSALWQWIQHVADAFKASQELVEDGEGWERQPEEIQEARVLYFGDHDPDGWQIPRSAEEAIRELAYQYEVALPRIVFERVALNMEQIEQYRPPPFPAKETSSRFASYVREHGIDQAWELDALRPEVLRGLITGNVTRYWNEALYDSWRADAAQVRNRLRKRMLAPGWLHTALA